MFRFTIRDVLWLTVVVAMWLGWWLEHSDHRVVAFQYERLKTDVVLCPDNMRVVFVSNDEFRYEALPMRAEQERNVAVEPNP